MRVRAKISGRFPARVPPWFDSARIVGLWQLRHGERMMRGRCGNANGRARLRRAVAPLGGTCFCTSDYVAGSEIYDVRMHVPPSWGSLLDRSRNCDYEQEHGHDHEE